MSCSTDMTEAHQLKFIFCKVFNTIVDNFVESVEFFLLTPKLFNTMIRFAQFLCTNLFQEAVRRNNFGSSPAEKTFSVKISLGTGTERRLYPFRHIGDRQSRVKNNIFRA